MIGLAGYLSGWFQRRKGLKGLTVVGARRWGCEDLLVEMLDCGDSGPRGRWRLCPHLLAAVPQEGSLEWWRVLPEQGLGGDLICRACSALPGAQRRLVSCCEGCLAVIEQDVSYFLGFLGTPKIRERPQPLASEIAPGCS